MRVEILIFIIAALIIANIYTEGKILKKLLSFKKYYKMIGVAVGALILYILIKKNPIRAQQVISTTNDYIKYLPIDRNTSNFISPILDFTSKQDFTGGENSKDVYNYPVVPMPNNNHTVSENRMLQSGKKATKRSVSETKKKYVASNQDWKCGDCGCKLPAWFEVDHKIRLEYGGSNHVDNLVAMCRDCHGKKTAIENL
jgi:5-methylcytosine-specific restriction endonuclease McrA